MLKRHASRWVNHFYQQGKTLSVVYSGLVASSAMPFVVFDETRCKGTVFRASPQVLCRAQMPHVTRSRVHIYIGMTNRSNFTLP